MPLVINTNVSSLNSQRQLVNSGMDLDQAMERLSSGKRVNNAADDAAGLAIANRMTSQIMGLNQSIRNANDGVSMIQTAEGALDETTNILQRMRELAIQSANGIYSDADRSTLDAEVQQLKAELDRIAESTTFNGQPLLDGSLGDVTLQVGSEEGDTIDLSISAMDTDSLGGGGSGDVVGIPMTDTIANIVTSIATSSDVTINSQSVGDLSGVTTLDEFVAAFNQNVSGVETSAYLELTGSADGNGVITSSQYMQLAVLGSDGQTQTFRISDTGSMTGLAEKINDITGGTIAASVNDDGRLELTSSTSESIAVTYSGASAANTGIAATTYRAGLSFEITDSTVENIDIAVTGTIAANTTALAEDLGIQNRTNSDITGNIIATPAALNDGDLMLNGVAISGITLGGSAVLQADLLVAAINESSEESGVVATADTTTAVLTLNSVEGGEITIDFIDGGGASYASTGLLETNNASTIGDSVSGIEIDTADGATRSLDVIDRALETINAIRADLGAVNNRLEFTMSNLANVVENTEAARSRIMDADFAAESAALSRAQVLQQASQAMLAQANARPQQVLQLLQG